MQTELPTMLNVLDTNYQQEFKKKSYTGIVCRETAIEGYCNGDIGFKIFDCHASDVYGRAHPQGTCVLLERLSSDSLLCYLL